MSMLQRKRTNGGLSKVWILATAFGFIAGNVFQSYMPLEVDFLGPRIEHDEPGDYQALSSQVAALVNEKNHLMRLLSDRTTNDEKKKTADDPTCNLSSQLDHLRRPEADYPAQRMKGPMQADEMLTVFSMIRSSSVRRVLEIGGWKGDSAWNFLEALRCKENSAVITVDKNPVKQWDEHPVPHKFVMKDAAKLTLDDIDGEPIDALLLDCHAFHPTQDIVRNILKNNFLAKDGIIFLHDTGLHPKEAHENDRRKPAWNEDPPGYVHQPVERLIAQWLQKEDCSFQRISLHDDARLPHPRHGLTIMQRWANLNVNDCTLGTRLEPLYHYEEEECKAIQDHTKKINESCPV